MKVKLLTDVPRVGNKNEIVEVADSFAINVLIKQGKAIIATPQIIKSTQKELEQKKKEKELKENLFLNLYEKLIKEKLIFYKKADEKGHLYAKVSSQEVVDEIYNKYKISLNPKTIKIQDHKSLGEIIILIKHEGKEYKIVGEIVSKKNYFIKGIF